jgi:integrase
MAKQSRNPTKYPGVYYILSKRTGSDQPERIYYGVYRKNGKLIEEKFGRQFKDDLTPAKANQIRTRRVEGKEPTNAERRAAEKAAKEGNWTIDRLWKSYKSQRTLTRNLKVDDNRYKNHLKGPFGDKEPHEVLQFDIDRVRIPLQKKRSPQTVKHVLALLNRIVNFGVKKGLSRPLPFTIDKPRVNNIVTEDLTPDELSRLLAAIENDKDHQVAAMMKLALVTGMRAGELFNLRWSDIDFQRGFINIKGPKGGLDQKIPLNGSAKQLLDSHQKTSSSYVFPSRTGGKRTTVQKVSNRIKKAANLPDSFRPMHGLRHVYASMLASSGKVDLYTLQRLLTHKSPSMTQRYAHLRDEALRGAADLAGSLIEQASNQSMPESKIEDIA